MKFSGQIGFWLKDVETKSGVFKPEIVEKSYVGDVIKNSRNFQNAESQQNDNLVVSNRLSIISDLYLQANWPSIKYVRWNNVNWRVKSVDVGSYPRVILEIGGVYNGKTSFT